MAVSFLTENKTMQTIRARVAFHSRQHGFDKCMQQILAANRSIPGSLIAELYAYWGDPLSASDEGFLRSCIAELDTATGPVLLCGASLMALILGAICDAQEEKSKQVWCLEQDRHWANLIRSWVTEYRISSAHVIQSQPRIHEDFVWYSVDTSRLADCYQLILCDGARATPRGIIGTLKCMENRLDERFTMLARNVKKPADLRMLNEWAAAHEAKFVLIDKLEGFVKLMRQVPATGEA
ncbi:MAG: hypothetical protein ACC642_09840, partial [Pseudomonadales bacterium]